MAKLTVLSASFITAVLAMFGVIWTVMALKSASHWLMNQIVSDCVGPYCSSDTMAAIGILFVISFMIVAGLLASIATLIWVVTFAIDRFAFLKSFVYSKPKKGRMRKCEPCGGPGPVLWDSNNGRYSCINCHSNPSDLFFKEHLKS